MEQEDDRYRAPALDKGLDILELLADIDGGLTQAEISGVPVTWIVPHDRLRLCGSQTSRRWRGAPDI